MTKHEASGQSKGVKYKKPRRWKPTDPDKCPAFSRGSGKQCKNYPSKEFHPYCNSHRMNSKTQRRQLGTKNSNYKNGNFSPIIQVYKRSLANQPRMLSALVSSSQSDSQFSLNPLIALFDAIAVEKLSTIELGNIQELKEVLTDITSNIMKIQKISDKLVDPTTPPKEMAKLIRSLGGLISSIIKILNTSQDKLKLSGIEELEKTLVRRAGVTKDEAFIQAARSDIMPVSVNNMMLSLQAAAMYKTVVEHCDEQVANKIITNFQLELKKMLNNKG